MSADLLEHSKYKNPWMLFLPSSIKFTPLQQPYPKIHFNIASQFTCSQENSVSMVIGQGVIPGWDKNFTTWCD